MATIPRRPTGLRTVVPPQSVNRATTTLAQRQAAQPFRSATKPMAKVNPMQLPMTPPQPFNPPPGTNQGMLPMVQQPAPQPFNPQPNPGQQLGGFGGKSAGSPPGGNGYQVGGDIQYDPFTGEPTPYQLDSMPMDSGNQPNSYNGQLDLTGMMGQQGQQPTVPQNMYGTQPSATPGGKSTGSSSSNASYGGGKSR